jgi:hypothetical protein
MFERIRTRDLGLDRDYSCGLTLGGEDLNLRLLAPHASALDAQRTSGYIHFMQLFIVCQQAW